MLVKNDIIDFINSKTYDIKITKNGRWIDQKCAIDVLSIIADCICDFMSKNPKKESFTASDIWHSQYATENVVEIFKKPDVNLLSAKNEYDKFFQQPIEMFAASQILKKEKIGRKNFYSVLNEEVLEYIALREKNSLFFLKEYIQKVLKDSGIYYLFDNFFRQQNKENYQKMKNGFSDFIIKHTKINGKTECNRIFIKVLNPLAYCFDSLGTVNGSISKYKITYDMLMYNRNNFRDIYAQKPKDVPRKEYLKNKNIVVNKTYYKYQSIKAKRYLKLFNENYRSNKTEHFEEFENGIASQIHHIFPESEFPEISYYLENLIALSPNQHLIKAHPMNNTNEISKLYQHLLLLSKAERIKENLFDESTENIYEFSKFLYVLSVGLSDDKISEIEDMDFESAINVINVHFAS